MTNKSIEHKWISDAAYYKALARNFAPNHEENDWIEATKEYEIKNTKKNGLVRLPKDVKFNKLVAKWKKEINIISDFEKIITNSYYLEIINLGKDAIPLILKDLEKNGGHWFHALESLTGENPIPFEYEGMTKKMTELWLTWGRSNNLINVY